MRQLSWFRPRFRRFCGQVFSRWGWVFVASCLFSACDQRSLSKIFSFHSEKQPGIFYTVRPVDGVTTYGAVRLPRGTRLRLVALDTYETGGIRMRVDAHSVTQEPRDAGREADAAASQTPPSPAKPVGLAASPKLTSSEVAKSLPPFAPNPLDEPARHESGKRVVRGGPIFYATGSGAGVGGGSSSGSRPNENRVNGMPTSSGGNTSSSVGH